MWALHEEEMDLSTHTSREKAGAFESEKSSSLYFELILTIRLLLQIKLRTFVLLISRSIALISVLCKPTD